MDELIGDIVRHLVEAREQALRDVEQLPRVRAAARAMGAPFYYPGVPCRFMHVSPRRTLNAKCCECIRADAIKAAVRSKPKRPQTLTQRRKAAARKAKAVALDEAREAKRAKVRDERGTRAKLRATAKAAATRAAKRASAHETPSI